MLTSSAVDPEIAASYEAYGCQVNHQSVEQIFANYHASGFLYSEKLQQLQPYWESIKRNWASALRGGEILMFEVSTMNREAWASLSSWRHTHRSWVTQHLASMGGPRASRDVMLSAQAIRVHDNWDLSHQNWFRPSNRFANRVFGGMVNHLDPQHCWLGHYSYSLVPLTAIRCGCKEASVTAQLAQLDDQAELCSLADQSRSPVYTQAEELAASDLNLTQLDQLYRLVGLSRFRRILLCRESNSGHLLGAAIVYRGPLGLNFSFLENRCDLLLHPQLKPEEMNRVAGALLTSAVEFYDDIPIQAIPVISNREQTSHLSICAEYHRRDYCQSIWLQAGFVEWYKYVASVFQRISSRPGD